MIKIRYCGICGDLRLVEKLKKRLSETTDIDYSDIEEIECGSCSMEVTMEGEKIFHEKREILDIDGIVEEVKASGETCA